MSVGREMVTLVVIALFIAMLLLWAGILKDLADWQAATFKERFGPALSLPGLTYISETPAPRIEYSAGSLHWCSRGVLTKRCLYA